ncbi:MAG: NAD(P)-dependent oxidoreductase [SAR324 cluster bacterium]|nr:NAD(P)-dependent oxidoreductase [SAR324 cluster bacterium]
MERGKNLKHQPALGFVGLGVMGEPMCLNLARKASSKIIGFDLSSDPLDRLAGDGVERGRSLSELARECGIVFLCLPDGKAVETVCMSSCGLITQMKKNSILVDMSTSPVDLTESIAALCRENKIFFADAPVARTREAAIQGDLSIMVGCTPSLFERLLPFLKHMGTEVTRCGEAGSGQIVKILNNMVLFQNVCALGEAIAVAKRNNVSPETLLGVLSKGSGDSFALRNHGMKSMLPGVFPARAFSTRYAKKDLNYALQLADSAGLDLKSAKVVMERFKAAEQSGFADCYFPAVLNVIDTWMN